jgi:hypothetical protein
MKRIGRATVAATLAFGLAAAFANPAAANPATLLNPVPAQNPGHDGRAYDVAISGGVAYVGGDFSNAVGYGGGVLQPRKNLAAYSVAGGALTGFAANTNGIVYAVISDGTSLYIGGDFTKVNTTNALRVAKLDLATGAVDASFTASANQSVRGLAVNGSTLYMAGFFNQVDGQGRKFAAAVDKRSGAIVAGFTPEPNNKAYAVELGPTGRLYLGGKFTAVGGGARTFLAELNPVNGAAVSPVSFKGLKGKVLDISLSPDGSQVLGAVDDGQNSAFAWNASNGAKQWSLKADGNVQDIVWLKSNVYFGFHDGFAGANNVRLLAADAATGALETGFQPLTNGLKGILGLATDGTRLVGVGDFDKMGGRSDRGVAIFG